MLIEREGVACQVQMALWGPDVPVLLGTSLEHAHAISRSVS